MFINFQRSNTGKVNLFIRDRLYQNRYHAEIKTALKGLNTNNEQS